MPGNSCTIPMSTRPVQLLLTDPSGVLRGKAVRRHELASLFSDGRNVAGSILGLDVTGVECGGHRPGGKPATPTSSAALPGTLRLAPWMERTGQVMPSMYELDGRLRARRSAPCAGTRGTAIRIVSDISESLNSLLNKRLKKKQLQY